jgi:TP901 family phage tail tape measure protein
MAALPQVGAQAALLGLDQFNKGVSDVTSGLNKIVRQTNLLEKASSTGWAVIGGATAAGMGLIAAGAGAAASALGVLEAASIRLASQYDAEMKVISAVSDATAKDMEDLSDEFLRIGRTSVTGMTEAANATTELIKGGVSAKDAMEGAAKAVSDLVIASAGELGLDRAAVATAGGLNAFNIAGNEAYRVVNSLTAASVRSAISLNDVVRSFQQVSSVAANANFTIEDTAAGIGVLGLAYLRGSDAGTSMKQMLIALQKPSKKALAMMQQYGISLSDAQGNSLGLRDVIGQLEKAFGDEAVSSGKVTEAQRNFALATIFGADAVRAAIIFARRGVKAYDELRQATEETSAAAIAAKVQQTPIAQLKIFVNNIQAAAIVMGSRLIPTILAAQVVVNKFLQSINPDIFKLFGDALLAITMGNGFDKLYEQANKLLGIDISKIFINLVEVFRAMRNAIVKDIIPSLARLAQALFGGQSAINLQTNALSTFASIITTAGKGIAAFTNILTRLVGWLKSSEIGMNALKTALLGLVVLPVAAFTALIIKLGSALLFASSSALLIAFGVGTAIVALGNLASQSESTLSTVDVAFRAAGVGVAAFAAVLVGRLAMALSVVAIGFAKTLVGVARFIASIALAGFALTTVAAKFIAAAAATFYFSVSALGQAIINLPRFIASVHLSSFALGTLAKSAFAAAVAIIGSLVKSIVLSNNALVSLAVTTAITIGKLVGLGAVAAATGAVHIGKTLVSAIIISIAAFRTLGVQAGFLVAKMAVAKVAMVTWGVVTALVNKGFVNITIALAVLAKQYALVAAAALASARATVAAWVATALPAITGAVTAGIAAIAPFIVGLLAIGLVIGGVAVAWANNWGDIQGITGKVLNWVSEKIKGFLDWLKQQPIIGGFIEEATTVFDMAKKKTEEWASEAGKGINYIVDQAKKGFPDLANAVGLGTASMDDYAKSIREAIEEQQKLFAGEQKRQQWLDDKGYGDTSEKPRDDGDDGGLGYPDLGGDETDSKTERIKKLTAQIQKMLSVLPSANKELAEFIATLADESPDRLQPMVDSLLKSKSVLDQIILVKESLLRIDLQLAQVEENIAAIQFRARDVELRQTLATIANRRKLIELRQQEITISLQEAPIRQKIAAVDSQIAKLQRENLDLTRQQVELQLKLLPLKSQVAELDRQLAQLNRTNYQIALQQAQIELDMLPNKQKIAAIEQQINDVIDERLRLTKRADELRAESEVASIEDQITQAEGELNKAWENKDIKEIIRLEALIESLKAQLSPAQARLEAIRREQEAIARKDELTQIGLELEKLALEESLKPLNDRLVAIQNQIDLQEAQNKITQLTVEQEKQAIQDVIDSLDEQLNKVNTLAEAERLRNQLAILGLESEKRALEDQLEPLETLRQAIVNETEAIQSQIDLTNSQFELQKLQFEETLTQEELKRNAFEQTRQAQAKLFGELVDGYIKGLTESRTFTTEEATETAKRMGLWDQQIEKLIGIKNEFFNIKAAADKVREAIQLIPDEKVIRIKIITDTIPSFASGGVVPGAYGSPQLVMAHGGERYLGIRGVQPTSTLRSVSNTSNVVNNYNNNYNVNANYSRAQSEASVRMDMSALVAMSRR